MNRFEILLAETGVTSSIAIVIKTDILQIDVQNEIKGSTSGNIPRECTYDWIKAPAWEWSHTDVGMRKFFDA